LSVPDASCAQFAPETDAPPILGATCVDTASLKRQFSGRGTSTHAALCDTAFAYIQAWCRNVKLLLSVSDASCAQFAPETDAPPFLGATCIDTASLKR